MLTLKKELRPLTSYGGSSTGSFDGGTGTYSRRQSKDSFIFSDPATFNVQDSIEMRKIKKVQSFFRGWLCRRRWKQIVEQYIKSPHAESMRKRNRYRNKTFDFIYTTFQILRRHTTWFVVKLLTRLFVHGTAYSIFIDFLYYT